MGRAIAYSVAASTLLFSACGQTEVDSRASPAAAPKYALLVPAPGALDFGPVPVGFPRAETVVLQNAGRTEATALSVVSGPTGPFSFAHGTYPDLAGLCGDRLAALASCILPIVFDPGEMGPFASELSISYHDGSAARTVAVPLGGEGVVEAAVLVASAGEDRELPRLDAPQTVTLGGSASFYRSAAATRRAPAGLAWSFVSGPVAVPVPSGPNAAVTIPPGMVGTFVFRLTATEGSLVDSDEVAVVVKPFVVTAADRIQVGFSHPAQSPLTASATASVSGTGATGPISWSWTVPSWLTGVAGQDQATLSFDAPKLEDLQDLPDVPRVLGLWGAAGDALRLSVTATDGVTSDSEQVVVSFGTNASGASTVPLGSPVYLAGGSSTGSWTWSWADEPVGSAATFRSVTNASLGASATTDHPVVWFVPTVEGRYVAIVERTVDGMGGPVTNASAITVVAARYASDGATAFVVPPSPAASEVRCAACHAGTIWLLADAVTPWKTTAHANVAGAALDPATPAMQAYQTLADLSPELQGRTTGFHLARAGTPSYAASSLGFDDLATTFKVDLRGLGLSGLAARFPEVASLVQVQCEACHGPGSQHLGDSSGISRTIVSDVCARCHASLGLQWATSGHRGVVEDAVTNTSCVRCHTAEAAIDPRATAFSYPSSPPAIQPPGDEGRESSATCATCHDPHSAANPAQLRLAAAVFLPGGTSVAAGRAAGCFQCHNIRRPPAGSVVGRSDPHPGAQGDMVAGANGSELPDRTYATSPHADPARFRRFDGTSAGDWCIACHMAPSSVPGAGGHTLRIRAPGGALNNPCGACHFTYVTTTSARTGAPLEEFAIPARGDWDGSGAADLVSEEVAGLLRVLGGSTAPASGAPFGVPSAPSDPAALLVRLARTIDPAAVGLIASHGRVYIVTDFRTPPDEPVEVAIPAGANGDLLWQAAWNYYFVIEDGSFGLHETGYAVTLLRESIDAILENLGDPPFDGDPYVPL
jgi:hypothetical protein